MTDFDPAQHRMVPEQRWFDDFRLGERFILPSRTMTEAVFLAFQAASGDAHPIHYDVEFCKARGMPGLLAHGLQTLVQTAPGAGLFPYMTEDALVGRLHRAVQPVPEACVRRRHAVSGTGDRRADAEPHHRCGGVRDHGPQPAAGAGTGGAAAVSVAEAADLEPLG